MMMWFRHVFKYRRRWSLTRQHFLVETEEILLELHSEGFRPVCSFRFSSVHSFQFCCSVMSNSLWPHGLQHVRPLCPSPAPGACSNSCPLSRWCHPAISSSVVPLSSCLLSFLTSGSFWMSQFFTSGGQSIGVEAAASVLPMNIQDCSHLGWTGWTSLLSRELSRVFSNTTVQKHQFFGTQLSL